MSIHTQATQHEDARPQVIDLELLALDLSSCTRCVGTLDHIEQAIDILRPVLAVVGARMRVRTIIVESEAQARRYRFATSPTVRIDGKDIAFETFESKCEACTDLCGCDAGTSCRVWRYRGEEFTEAPVGLVVESILRRIFGGRRESVWEAPAHGEGLSGEGPSSEVPCSEVPCSEGPCEEVPENLRRFFKGRSDGQRAAEPCCSEAEQETCCEPSEKSECCDTSHHELCACR